MTTSKISKMGTLTVPRSLFTVYRIDLNKAGIAALDMVLSAAIKDDSSEENKDIIHSLYDRFSRCRREIEREMKNERCLFSEI